MDNMGKPEAIHVLKQFLKSENLIAVEIKDFPSAPNNDGTSHYFRAKIRYPNEELRFAQWTSLKVTQCGDVFEL